MFIRRLGDFRFYYPCGDILFLALQSQHVFIWSILETQYTANSKYFGSISEASSPAGEIQAMWAMIGLCPSVSHFTLTAITVPVQGETLMDFVNCFVAV